MVDIEGVKRSHEDFSCLWVGCQLQQDVCLALGDVDPVLPDDTVHILQGWGAPVQQDVGGIECRASRVQWMATRSCQNKHALNFTKII